MQKVEKWRIQELGQILDRLSQLMRLGGSADWASVFSHYAHEACILTGHERFKLDALKKLVQNITHCFDRTSSLRNLVLIQENAKEMEALNQEFREFVRRLFGILNSLEAKWTESVH